MTELDQEEFSARLTEYCQAYYLTGQPLIDDATYDRLVELYQTKFDQPFINIGAISPEGVDHVLLPMHMASLDKVKKPEDFARWMKKLPKAEQMVLSLKADGVAGMLWYLGPLDSDVHLTTQGDGVVGVCINYLKKYLKLPPAQTVWDNGIRAVRLELIIKKQAFARLLESDPTMSNARSTMSGIVTAKTHDMVEKLEAVSGLALYCKYADSDRRSSERFTILQKLGFETVFNTTIPLSEVTLEKLQQLTLHHEDKASYDIDGLVCEADVTVHAPWALSFNLWFSSATRKPRDHCTASSSSVKNPAHAFALKLPDKEVETTVTRVTWSIGRFGVLSPTVHFQMVTLGKTQVDKATGKHGKWMLENKVGPGSRIKVCLSNKVIPFIVSVLSSGAAMMPEQPHKLVGCYLELQDPSAHREVQVAQWVHFFDELQVKHLAEESIQRLYDHFNGDLRAVLVADVEALSSVDRFQAASAKRLHKEIQKAKKGVPLGVLMCASSMFGKNLGTTTLSKIVTQYPDVLQWDVSTEKKIELIKRVRGIDELASVFVTGLDPFRAWLARMGDVFQLLPENKNSSTLKYRNVAFTGKRSKDLEAEFIRRGGNVVSSVTKKTDALVVTPSDQVSKKQRDALHLKVPVLSMEEFSEVQARA